MKYSVWTNEICLGLKWPSMIDVPLEGNRPEGLRELIIWIFLVLSSAYLGLKKGYLFMYNLVQFLGFSWIFVNLTVRLFILGQGSFPWFFFDKNTTARMDG